MVSRAWLILIVGVFPFSAVQADAVRLPNEIVVGTVDFERHVASLFSKHGCNAGACHGSFQGKGGFRLSLFGHDPEQDFQVVTRGALGRRIDIADPDRSLILLKASGQVAHGGGKRFDNGSWQYGVLRAWIAQGGGRTPGSGSVKALSIEPPEHTFQRPGQITSLQARAQFADGTAADVTPFCDFRAKDDSIAEVTALGEVRGLSPGDTPIIVSFRGNLAVARILVPFDAGAGAPAGTMPESNFIDREVFAKQRRLNIVPSESSSDAEFLRRVTIDTIGTLPAPDAVREFLASSRPDKREHKINELLAHPLHAALWATKFCDITACNIDVMDGSPDMRVRRAKMWHDWFRKRMAENRPYDQIIKGVLMATSREGCAIDQWLDSALVLDRTARTGFATQYADRSTLDLFWQRVMGEDFFPLEQMAELTAAAFLGVRIECAQCHKHPFDRWTQDDYRAFANVFAQVRFGSSPELTAAMVDRLAQRRQLSPDKAGPPIPRMREIYVTNHRPRRLIDPETNNAPHGRALGGPPISAADDFRESLFRWMIQPDNPYFARSFVNRVWAHYFGVGLVDPVDSFSAANPPSNEKLLDALARDFIANGSNIRRLERAILQSRTYQLSSRPNPTNQRDRTNFSHACARPMMAEAVVDALNAALGSSEDFGGDALPQTRAIELATNRVRSSYASRVFRIFGRPVRNSTCDCERPTAPAVPQALFLMSDPIVLEKLAKGRLAKLLSRQCPDADIIDEVFLASLSRFPDANEKQAALEHITSAKDRLPALIDIVWALINTREFILNH